MAERTLTLKILGDAKSAEAALDRTAKATDRVGPSASTANKALDGLTSNLTSRLPIGADAAKGALDKIGGSALSTGSALTTGIVGGAAVAGAALAAFALSGVSNFIELAGEVRNFQRASGASAEESSRFVAALDDLGISSETGSKAIFKLGKEAADGSPKLAALGIEIARSKDGSTDLVGTLLNVADAYVKTSDPAKRAELAFAAFGKQGQELIPVLEQGRAGLDAFFKGADKGRQIFSQEDLDKARKYELALDSLEDAFGGLQRSAGEALIPFLTALAQVTAGVLDFIGSLQSGTRETETQAEALASLGDTGSTIDLLAQKINQLLGREKESVGAAHELEQSHQQLAEAAREAARASEEQAKALERVLNATLATLGGQLAYEASVNTLKDNIADLDDKQLSLNDAIAKHGPASKEAETATRALRDAELGIEESALRAAGAAGKLAESTAIAEGRSLSAAEKYDIQRSALIDLANQTSGPTRGAILGLVAEMDRVRSKNIAITADTGQALSAIGALRVALGSVFGFQLPASSFGGGRHAGGPVSSGSTYVVGEKGPELLHMGSGSGNIIPNNKLGGGGGTTVVINVHAGTVIGTRREFEEAVAVALKSYNHRNGLN